MTKVFDMELEREKRLPHTTGQVRCQSCGLTWQAVWPTDTPVSDLECPECRAQWAEVVEPLTLNETLAKLGFTTRPGEHQYEKDILKDGKVVFTGSAGDVWDWLQEEGMCPS